MSSCCTQLGILGRLREFILRGEALREGKGVRRVDAAEYSAIQLKREKKKRRIFSLPEKEQLCNDLKNSLTSVGKTKLEKLPKNKKTADFYA